VPARSARRDDQVTAVLTHEQRTSGMERGFFGTVTA
jgi:hypothetical protein